MSLMARSVGVVLVSLAAFPSAARAEQLESPDLHFSLTIPDEFRPDPRLVAAKPDFVYAYRKEEPEGLGVVIIVERMRGTIGRAKLDLANIPKNFAGRLLTVRWQGFDLEAFEVPEDVGGVATVNYNVQVPLKREAIQLRVLGRLEEKDKLLELTNTLLAGLQGESNWLASSAPPALASSPYYGKIILAACAAGVLGGATVLWLLRRRSRRGTVLALGVLIYVASWSFAPGQTREARAAVGTLRMIGSIGVLLGLFDLVRHPRPVERATVGEGTGANPRDPSPPV